MAKRSSNILWRPWLLPPDPWGSLRYEIDRVIRAAIPNIEKAIRQPDPLVSILLGKVFSAASNMERSLVTKIGNHGYVFVRPFFHSCEHNGTFWHLRCRRLTRDGEEHYFTVKVVSGVRAFNSTLRARVENEAATLENPIVLTLTGRRKTPVTRIGRAWWLDAPTTWRWLSLDPRGYTRFLELLYEVATPLRERLQEMFWEEYRAYKARAAARATTKSG